MQTFLDVSHMQWYHFTAPSKTELEELVHTYDLHEIIEEDLMERSTQDKVDVYDQYLFVVMHIPQYNQRRGKYVLNEFKIILGKEFIVTMASRETKHFQKIKSRYQTQLAELEEDEQYKLSPYYVLYKIVDVMHDKVLRGLKFFAADLAKIEENVFEDRFADMSMVSDITLKRRNIMMIKHAILPQDEILEELQKEVMKKLGGTKLEVYFEDLEYKINKIAATSAFISEDIESLYDAYDAMMTTRTNANIMRLTIFTVILGILTLVTGFYGMNIPLPGQELGLMVVYVFCGMGLVSVLLYWGFRRMGWL